MGLTKNSTGKNANERSFLIKKQNGNDLICAVAGNPNVGKSTLFNALTGMKQHTGNWAGKTVTNAQGICKYKGKTYILVDIPGTYSLYANSPEEEVARNFICFGQNDACIVVCDATCLERNLNLVLQILEITENVIVCVNLLDEAERKGIKIDLEALSQKLGVAVVGTVARNKKSLNSLLDELDGLEFEKSKAFKLEYPEPLEKAISIVEYCITKNFENKINSRWLSVRLLENDSDICYETQKFLNTDFSQNPELQQSLKIAREYLCLNGIEEKELKDIISSSAVFLAQKICQQTVVFKNKSYLKRDRKADKILTSKLTGYPVMLVLLAVILWITITGANYISEILSEIFSITENGIENLLNYMNTPLQLKRFLIEGVYRIPAWVVSVMLPPMAIFFPLFTILEDIGYLPRVAYNLDKPFKCCKSCGKQALTMCMGFGCNAAGVVGCRIIDSKRERLLAIITNSFVPCNGRFPMLISIISMFFVVSFGGFSSFISAAVLTLFILLSIAVTFFSTFLLSKILLKGVPTSYTLEMPPFRKPQWSSIILHSVFDRTLFVLGRAVSVAIPAGIIIFLLANITAEGKSLLIHSAQILDPFARLLGLDGVILIAFILGFPANEIVLPIALMGYLANGNLAQLPVLTEMSEILRANGWTATTALCTIIFSLFHWPCSTTLLTVKKETGSIKWTVLSAVLPTLIGIAICMLISFVSRVAFA